MTPITDVGSGSVREKEEALLTEIIAKFNNLFEGELTEHDKPVSEPGDGVEFVVAHHRKGGTRVHQAPGNFDRFNLLRPAINEVPNKNRDPVRMTPSTIALLVTHLPEKRDERISLAMDVTDDVVAAARRFDFIAVRL